MTGDLFEPFALNTNIYMGYDLATALEGAASAGFGYVEIASIVGNCEHVKPGEMTDAKTREIRGLLDANGLSLYAFSGHGDLTDPGQYEDFLVKMRFASSLGATVINTNSGPVAKKDVFFRNMEAIIALAEKLGLTVCLESHGDIVDTAAGSVAIMERFSHPLVRLNYDTGNTLYYARGDIDLAEDLRHGLPYLAHIHLKDVHLENGWAWYRPIGEGDVDFAALFAVLAAWGKPVPCALEIPVFVEGPCDALSPDKAPLPRETIDRAVAASLETVRSLGAVRSP